MFIRSQLKEISPSAILILFIGLSMLSGAFLPVFYFIQLISQCFLNIFFSGLISSSLLMFPKIEKYCFESSSCQKLSLLYLHRILFYFHFLRWYFSWRTIYYWFFLCWNCFLRSLLWSFFQSCSSLIYYYPLDLLSIFWKLSLDLVFRLAFTSEKPNCEYNRFYSHFIVMDYHFQYHTISALQVWH